MSTSGKSKASASTNGVEAYNKETLNDEIRRLTTANVQLIADKIEIEKAKVNLEADKTRLLDKKKFSSCQKRRTSNRDRYIERRRTFQRPNPQSPRSTFKTNIKQTQS